MDMDFSFSELNQSQKVQLYTTSIKPMLNDLALFSDGSISYRIPQEPSIDEDVRVRIRTERENVETVFLIYKTEDTSIMKVAKTLIIGMVTSGQNICEGIAKNLNSKNGD